MATFAMEMHVCVVIMCIVMATAKFIFCPFPIVDGMHQSTFAEQRECAEYPRFVDG